MTVTTKITIDDTANGDKYPPILLSDDPEKAGGKLISQCTTTELLLIDNGVKVALAGGLILQGNSSSKTVGGVWVDNASEFVMYGGIISDHFGTASGGVYLRRRSTFTMSGGTISGNTGHGGGGVQVSSSTFIMSGGTITDNLAANDGGSGEGLGGGVYMNISAGTPSTFTMSGGTITGNRAFNGGGIYMKGKETTITLKGNGKITNNSTVNEIVSAGTHYGGGAAIMNGSIFNMQGGEISGNSGVSGTAGIGVYVDNGAAFSKTGGTISSDNKPTGNGTITGVP
jgi:hypothetical protein